MTEEGLPDWRLDRILSAVETIEESLGVLADKQSTSRAAFERDSDLRDIVERRFVKVTEAALDIGTAIVTYERGAGPTSNPATMRALGELGVLSEKTTDEMVRAARFRNVLAHTYGDDVDHDVVYDALQDLERYRTFLRSIREYLESVGALSE